MLFDVACIRFVLQLAFEVIKKDVRREYRDFPVVGFRLEVRFLCKGGQTVSFVSGKECKKRTFVLRYLFG